MGAHLDPQTLSIQVLMLASQLGIRKMIRASTANYQDMHAMVHDLFVCSADNFTLNNDQKVSILLASSMLANGSLHIDEHSHYGR